MISRTASEIRRLSYNLHPALLVDLGLEPALELYFKEIEKHVGLDIEFNIVGFDQRPDMDMETVFYRFSQEALTNALKHSGAEEFKLSIIKSYPRIIFMAEDDGVGFDPQIIGKDKKCLGLSGMRDGYGYVTDVDPTNAKLRFEWKEDSDWMSNAKLDNINVYAY